MNKGEIPPNSTQVVILSMKTEILGPCIVICNIKLDGKPFPE